MKIGAFAVFLREMGWGKLFELPPLNRKEITEALDPSPTMPPPSASSGRSSLFDVIEDAGQQTTKLDPEAISDPLNDGADDVGLAQELDIELLGSPEVPGVPSEPEDPQISLEQSGAPEIPAPIGKVLPLPASEEAPPEPPVTIRNGDSYGDDEIESYEQPKPKKKDKIEKMRANKKKSKVLPRLLILAMLLALAYAAYSYIWPLAKNHILKKEPADPPFTLEPKEEDLPSPRQETADADQPSQAVREDEPPAQAPPVALVTEEEARPKQPAALVQADIAKEARFGALANGNIARALEQGSAFQATVPKYNWTIRLILACQLDGIQYCAQTLGPSFELFLRPYRFRDGRQCYQLFVGRFPNSSAAEDDMKKIMQLLTERKVEPKIMQISDISENQ
jgi:hypothetical protein